MSNVEQNIEVESVIRSLDDLPAEEKPFRDEQAKDPHVDAQSLPPDMDLETTAPLRAAREWRVAKCLLALRQQVNEMAPGRDKSSDGTIGDLRHCGPGGGSSDHCPNVSDGAVGVVTAMDITDDPRHGCSAEAIVQAIWHSRDPRVKYLIWNRRIANSSAIGAAEPWAWRPYGGSNPHDLHCHISVKSDHGLYDSTLAWTLPASAVS